jgi:type IV pilus assembly protein PilX
MKKQAIPAQGFLRGPHERGASLVTVLIILTIVSMLGIAGIQISMMSERGARNDRDQQIAWEAAEAALLDAEQDIFGPATSSRRSIFTPVTNAQAFVDGCGTGGNNSQGLCATPTSGRPVWLTPNFDFSDSSNSARSTAYGTFTERTFAAGSIGIQPVQRPRYVIEPIRDPADRDLSNPSPQFVYRVTAMGFGPRKDIQAVVQMIYRN